MDLFFLVAARTVVGGWVEVVFSLVPPCLCFLGEACNIFYGLRWARLVVILPLSLFGGTGAVGFWDNSLPRL